MRLYRNFTEAFSEIRRDVKEMGIRVHTQTYQDKFIGDNPDFEQLEVQNYVYTVTKPLTDDLEPTEPWASAEWEERVSGILGFPVNPGSAWELREEVWEEFLNSQGQFSYTYSDRLSRYNQVKRVIEGIREDPASRQLYISVWDPSDIENIGGKQRVPCTLGYLVQVRKEQLNLTYFQRSCDLVTHFENDVFFAHLMQRYIAFSTGLEVGNYTHFINSLHAFRKDLEGVF